MPGRRFAVRTVRAGSVLIDGVRYRPQGNYVPYDGRLDGQRFAFGLYPAPWKPGGREPFVSLWGTEASFRDESLDPTDGPQVVDGTYPWEFWEAVA